MNKVDRRIEYTHSGVLEKQPKLDDCFVIERITADNIGVIQGGITPSFSWKDRDVFSMRSQPNLTKNSKICKLRLVDRWSLLFYDREKC